MVDREQTTIRLPADLKQQIQRRADEMGLSFNAFIMTAINEFIRWHQE